MEVVPTDSWQCIVVCACIRTRCKTKMARASESGFESAVYGIDSYVKFSWLFLNLFVKLM